MYEKAREQNSESVLQRALCSFECKKDLDIESFLHNKAIPHIQRNTCSVYLILDEEKFDEGKINIVAYFTLSARSVRFHENISKSKIKNIAGFKDRTSVPVVLIGQIGKHISNKYTAKISLNEILSYAFEIILAANELIPCRAVLVECSEIIHNHGIYEKAGFRFLQKDGDFYQYYRII